VSADPTKIEIEFDPTSKRMAGIARHGNTPFDVPFISQIDGNLWQGGCEDGLILPTFFKHLISLYPWEAYTVGHQLSSALEVRLYDSEDQALDQVDAIAAWVKSCVDDGPTLVHCQAGLNRSSLIAGRVLTMSGLVGRRAVDTVQVDGRRVDLNPIDDLAVVGGAGIGS